MASFYFLTFFFKDVRWGFLGKTVLQSASVRMELTVITFQASVHVAQDSWENTVNRVSWKLFPHIVKRRCMYN